MLDLHHADPDQLATGPSFHELAEAIPSGGPDETVAELLDYVYRQRLVRLLAGRHSAAELAEFGAHLAAVLRPSRRPDLDAMRRAYATRWSALRDLLETRSAQIADRRPDEVRSRAHVPEILQMIRNQGGSVDQGAIGQALQLRPANLTRILNLMEASELITRTRSGKKRVVHLGPEEAPPPKPRSSDRFSRPMSAFVLNSA